MLWDIIIQLGLILSSGMKGRDMEGIKEVDLSKVLRTQERYFKVSYKSKPKLQNWSTLEQQIQNRNSSPRKPSLDSMDIFPPFSASTSKDMH